MALVLGVIATSPGDQTQERETAHNFELVDVQPTDTGDHETMAEESDDDAGESPAEEPGTADPDTEDSGFAYENCDAARAAGAAPVLESDHGFGPHLDADNDGIGCE
ncbi:excalibur calcium-binding domain-containing protein [Glycomyces tenuis]|uniref:excalibur calcium-binding domain-containing protein n=1 Tax=Glycomyces tenuis TaxID=58116 RepID=UPI000688404A|nr:excalibur calcium-binding domain-containing protein [Glycomyces tenuis]